MHHVCSKYAPQTQSNAEVTPKNRFPVIQRVQSFILGQLPWWRKLDICCHDLFNSFCSACFLSWPPGDGRMTSLLLPATEYLRRRFSSKLSLQTQSNASVYWSKNILQTESEVKALYIRVPCMLKDKDNLKKKMTSKC